MIRIALLLIAAGTTAAGWWATQKVVVPTVNAQPDNRWVRTADGWQHPKWEAGDVHYEPRLHPTLTASLFAFSSALALLALPVGRRPSSEQAELQHWRAASAARPRIVSLNCGRK